MPGEGSSFRSIPRTAHPRNLLGSDNEPTENEFEASLSSLHFPPPRTPLNSIPDPSQCHKDTPQGSDFNDCKDKPETTRPGRMLDRKLEGLDRSGTPRIFNNRQGKAHSEPNSAQSTPARSGSRVSLGGGGAMGSLSATGARSTLFSKGKEMNFCGSRGSRGISSSANSELNAVEVSHFELDENPSFWRDHNVQVLIRIRPLSNMERASQGYGRCLRQESGQTLVWLGHPETRFTFDHIACETISQEKLFRVAGLPMVENCLSGYNSCMFAYGQTGSGKTYTMMGEINPVEGKLGEYRGITPRIFEYLFSRIEMEEEGRRDEKLKFSCKCSFLEIYNEQITDLLEPASTNLQLREDLNKGVYVENLTEYNVRTVDDVIKLLLQGAANRKMAATHMNSESSRSHSVFTCIIESSWERDSLSHFRFARLNLVDLAGSERQKSSGAEGDRLKEAANINKSLSTLGLVIMSLVDIAHGKHRHVPYRDSRLTFLLQDSLGGNSKTTIIANVSPSVCSANETLSTLKFAQRAKLIQNNAKVNEDASGDVGALQRQIQQLKDQLSFLMKNHNHSTSLFGCIQSFEASGLADDPEIYNSSEGKAEMSDRNIFSIINKKMKCMEATLTGALRREKMAEIALHKLEAEIEHLNRLARQREDDLQRTKMLLRFREDKIKQLELSVNGSLPADHYLTEENKALREEIQILQERIDKNPEVTRFALENIRLIEQLQLFQNYYELGERETLLSEISELRDQLLETLERKPELFSRHVKKDDNTAEELEDCRNMNSRLMREVDELRGKLSKYLTCNQASFDSASNSQTKDPDEIRHTDKYSLVETISSGSNSDDEIALYTHTDDVSLQSEDEGYRNVASAIQPGDTKKELKDTNLITKPMKSEQAHLINELQLMRDQNCRFMEIVNKKDKIGGESPYELGRDLQELQNLERENIYRETSEDTKSKDLRGRLEKLTKDLEEARLANCQYQEDRASLLSQHNQMELVCEQVEMETSQTILHLQEEVNALQLELNERLCCMTQENMKLRNQVAAKDEEIRKVCGEWERAALELTSFLVEGSRSLKDASGEIQRIACSFPQINVQTGEQVKRAARACIDKEEMILQLEKSLEDAQKMVVEMELKLDSLKQATMALNRLPQSENEDSAEETIHIGMLLNEKISTVKNLESKVKFHEDNIIELEKRADAAFLVVKWLSDRAEVAQANSSERAIHIPKLDSLTQDIKAQLKLENMIIDCEAAIGESLKDAERHIATLQMDVLDMSTTYLKLVQNSIEEINEMRSKFTDAKVNQVATVKLQVSEPKKLREFGKELDCRYRIIDELAKMNERLRKIKDSIDSKISASGSLLTEEYLTEADSSADNSTSGYSTSSSDGSIGSVSCTFCYEFSEEMMDIRKSQEQSAVEAEPESSKKLLKSSCQTEEVTFCPRKELERTFDAFHVLYSYVTKVLNENDIWDSTRKAGKINEVESFRSGMETVEACCKNTRQAVAADKVNRTFFGSCEEVRATMKEADYMLNALLKAHESAQQMNGMWRQTSQELMRERSMLIEENEQLKSSVLLKEAENKLLQEEISRGLVEVASSMSLLEGCFQQLRSELEDKYKLFYLDILSMGRQMLCLVSNSRSSLEEIHSEIMERGFSLSALHHCGEEILYKTPRVNVQPGFCPFRLQESQMVKDTMQSVCASSQDDIMNACKQKIEEASVENQCRLVTKIEGRDLDLSHEELLCENLSLKKELERKEILLKGLLFDFSLLQETASNKKDVKDETEKLILALTDIRHELEMKTSEVDDLLVQHRKLESLQLDTENALSISRSDLEQAEERIDSLSDQNAELRILLKDLYVKKSEAEVQLEEQKDVVKGLEKEIIHLNSSVEEKVRSSVELLEEDLRNVSNERDQLQKEIFSLNEKLEMAYALADENEAIAVEARQESERSKLYAEQKEEEVKILEHSVEELESTINMLEKKVYEMNEEVERHRSIRDSLELELEAWRQKLSKVENLTDFVDTECGNSLQIQDLISRQLESRLLELQAAHNQIRVLEKHISDKDKEIKQCKEYISELVLHSEAQASQYQEKYKTLEAMVHEVKMNSASVAAVLDKSEKISMRTRGSSSPFRCISSLVQQMHLEKDQELSAARLRIEELEAVLASRQKEVCMLNARLAAAESMTHDVIRDLLLVKLDMTNYANLIDQHQVQKLVEEAHQQTEEFLAKEQEVINLRKQIDDLIEERESCQSELDKKAADILAAEMTVEQLQDRDQMLSAQNEMLKKDKSNLLRKISELDDMVKTLLGTQSTQNQIKQTSKTKDNGALRLGDADLTKKLARSEKLLNRVNDELVQYRKSTGSRPHSKTQGHPSESKHR